MATQDQMPSNLHNYSFNYLRSSKFTILNMLKNIYFSHLFGNPCNAMGLAKEESSVTNQIQTAESRDTVFKGLFQI